MGVLRGFLVVVAVMVARGEEVTETEMTIRIYPGKVECFYETVEAGTTFYVEYNVVGSNLGEMLVNFQVVNTKEKPIITEFRKIRNQLRLRAEETGPHRFCFDNSFSTFSYKTVSFYFNPKGASRIGSNRMKWKGADFVPEKDVHQKQAEDIRARLEGVYQKMAAIRSSQDVLRLNKLKDRIIAESNFNRVNFWSLTFCTALLVLGVFQVFFIKSLFDPKYDVGRIVRNFTR